MSFDISERELLQKAKQGDIEAFEALIQGCQKMVYNIALRILGNGDDANEVVQEVFIRIFKSIKDFKGNSSFSTWVYRITTNICLDELRRRKKNNTLSLDKDIRTEHGDINRQVEDSNLTPEEVLEKGEVIKAVQEAINSLPDEYRVVIVLRDIQGYTYDEIAKILGCPQGTIKSRINRARHALRSILINKRELFSKDFVNY